MDNLPDELLLMIFDRVPSRDVFGSVFLVCQRWAALAKQRALLIEHPDDFSKMHRRIDTVRVVTRLPSPKAFLLNSAKIAPYIRDLTVYAVSPFGPEHFGPLSQLRHLEHLDIFLRDRILDTQLIPVLARLTSVVINEIISARVLRALAATQRLRALHLFGRSQHYPRREISIFLRAKRLVLSELTLRCTELPDSAYAAIGSCESLTSLQLYSCWLLTGDGIMPLTRLRRLRKLHITGARMVRTISLVSFIDRLPLAIEELNLSASWFGEEHIAALAHRLPNLRILELWRSRLTSSGVINLAEAMQGLRMLDLDLMLSNQEIKELDMTHPNLLRVRCLTEHSVNNTNRTTRDHSEPEVPKPVTQNIKILPTDDRYPFKYFRGSGEGYRGTLFYYWTQSLELTPLPSEDVPAYDEDDDFY